MRVRGNFRERSRELFEHSQYFFVGFIARPLAHDGIKAGIGTLRPFENSRVKLFEDAGPQMGLCLEKFLFFVWNLFPSSPDKNTKEGPGIAIPSHCRGDRIPGRRSSLRRGGLPSVVHSASLQRLFSRLLIPQ